jgi:hypothetical protein
LNSVFAQYEELSSPQFAVINLSLRLLHTVLNLIKLLLNIFSVGWWTLFRTLKKSPYAELTWSETFVCNYSVTESSSFSTWIYIVHVIYIFFSFFFFPLEAGAPSTRYLFYILFARSCFRKSHCFGSSFNTSAAAFQLFDFLKTILLATSLFSERLDH